jgi:hypothetical protein
MAWNLIFHVLIEGITVSFHLPSDLVVLLLKWIVKLMSVIIAIFLFYIMIKELHLLLYNPYYGFIVSVYVYIFICVKSVDLLTT